MPIWRVFFKFLPWLAMMMLGLVFDEWLMTKQQNNWAPQRLLLVSGLLALLCFVLIRSIDGLMYLEGDSIVPWLHVSRYPPSLACTTLELGLMAIILAALMRIESIMGVCKNGLVLAFGQTALFFYLTHFCVLAVLSAVLGRGGLEQTYLIAMLVLVILYPVCRIYRTSK